MKKAKFKKKAPFVTLMYIPENESTVRSLRIPSWFPKAVTISISMLMIFSVVCVFALNSLNVRYNISKEDIKALTTINNRQKNEIEKLQANAEEIQRQLEENSKALEEVKKAVGLDGTVSQDEKSQPASGASDSTSAKVNYLPMNVKEGTTINGHKYSDMTADLGTMSTYYVSLLSEAKQQKEIIDSSTVSVNKQIVYLSYIPSIKPVNARISAGYGYRRNPFSNRGREFHKGLDFAANYGTNVAATADGKVIFAGWQGGYGRLVVISHGNGITTLYAHNSKLLVKKGDIVKKGQFISKVGSSGRSTGPHLHYEVKINGKSTDPTKYIK
ncbi:MAG: M23 family metallopeptidase [Bacillota bacterium]